jgi:hypothetical protein
MGFSVAAVDMNRRETMSNPDLDRQLSTFLEEEAARRKAEEGITLKSIHDALKTHVNDTNERFDELGKRLDKHDDRWERLRKWRHLVWSMLPASRPPQPTLNPDDSGSIEIGAFGAKAAFEGKLPVRIASVLIVLALGGGIMYMAGVAMRIARSGALTGQAR